MCLRFREFIGEGMAKIMRRITAETTVGEVTMGEATRAETTITTAKMMITTTITTTAAMTRTGEIITITQTTTTRDTKDYTDSAFVIIQSELVIKLTPVLIPSCPLSCASARLHFSNINVRTDISHSLLRPTA